MYRQEGGVKRLPHLYLEGLQWGTLVLTDGDITRISCEWATCHCKKKEEEDGKISVFVPPANNGIKV